MLLNIQWLNTLQNLSFVRTTTEVIISNYTLKARQGLRRHTEVISMIKVDVDDKECATSLQSKAKASSSLLL